MLTNELKVIKSHLGEVDIIINGDFNCKIGNLMNNGEIKRFGPNNVYDKKGECLVKLMRSNKIFLNNFLTENEKPTRN